MLATPHCIRWWVHSICMVIPDQRKQLGQASAPLVRQWLLRGVPLSTKHPGVLRGIEGNVLKMYTKMNRSSFENIT